MDLELILSEKVGGGGRWQWKKLALIFMVHVALGIPLLMHMFTAFTPKHRCFVPGCDKNMNPSYQADFLNFTLPQGSSENTFLQNVEGFDSCSMFSRVPGKGSTCTSEQFSKSVQVKCSKFVYDTSEFRDTLTTELNLVCDRKELTHFLGTVVMMGLTIGSFLGGRIGDFIGRKRALLTGLAVVVPSVFLGAFVSNYFVYILLRLITCTVLVFGWIACNNFQLEWFSQEHRMYSFAISNAVSHLLNVVAPIIVYFNRTKRDIHLWFSAITIPSFLITWKYIPESPRWLACNAKQPEAEKIIQDIASTNGRTLTSGDLVEIRDILDNLAQQTAKNHDEGKHLSSRDLFIPSLRSRTLTLICAWVSVMVSFYAILLNVDALSGDIMVNYAIGAIVDVPAILLSSFVVDIYGRCRSLSSFMTGLGLCCIVMAFLPKDHDGSGRVLFFYFAGKFCAAGAANLCWLLTSELYPTNLRSQALGTCSMTARIFGMTSAFVSDLAYIWTPLPMLVLGVPTIAAGLSVLTLPETMGLPLPETLDEAIALKAPALSRPKDLYSLLRTYEDSEDDGVEVRTSSEEEDDHQM